MISSNTPIPTLAEHLGRIGLFNAILSAEIARRPSRRDEPLRVTFARAEARYAKAIAEFEARREAEAA